MENTSNKNEEIDLRLVYNKIKQFFSSIWNLIENIFLIIQKRWILCISLLLIGVGVGIGLFYSTKPIFSASITLTSSLLSNEFCADEINELQTAIEDNTPSLLAKKLKIDTNSAKEIKKIEFSNYDEQLKKKFKDKDTVVRGLPFKIIAYTTNNTVFDTLQNALINYLENNSYALKRKEIKKQSIQLMHDKLINEIRQIDSLKNIVAGSLAPRGNTAGFVFGQPIDPISIYKEGITLFQNELDLNRQSVLIDNIQVITDFAPRSKPDKKIWRTSSVGGIAGFLLGLLIAIILERRKSRD